MDANGLRFWLIADDHHWSLDSDVQYDDGRRSLRLASERAFPLLAEAEAPSVEIEASGRIEQVPRAMDRYGTSAYWDAGEKKVMARSALPNDVDIYQSAPGDMVTDLVMGYDDVLYIADEGRVVMLDRRGRWEPVILQEEGFVAWRLAADPSGGVWALDRTNRQLARVRGLPLPKHPYEAYAHDTFRPESEDADPPRMNVLPDAVWPAEETPIGIACSPEGRLATLNWADDNDARICCLTEEWKWSEPWTIIGARYPYSFVWLSGEKVAVLLVSLPSEAFVYAIKDQERMVESAGDFYPLKNHEGGAFLKGTTLPPHYPVDGGSLPLHRLSLVSYAREGRATNKILLDSEDAQTVWHRLYLEANIPDQCSVRIFLAASDHHLPPHKENDWHEHRFGERSSNGNSAGIPHGAWISTPSEIPFHPGLIPCRREKDRTGLFMTLIQRSNRPVRTLRGRYLHVRVALSGDGRTTPEIWALRAYGSRFSYLNRYLPALYHETLFGDETEVVISATSPSTRPDFLERFLDLFESVLTPLEDEIANAYLLTDPRTTLEESLRWLGSWIGVDFDSAYPSEKARALLLNAPALFRWRGTLRGMSLALNIAAGGAVEGGEIVILEEWRLRRTFATILGADLADEYDPLLCGLAVSGNSYVGDTLFLGDENRKEFLALFSADLPKSAAEEAAVREFLDRLSNRVTVLVHQKVTPQDLGLIRRIVHLEKPAHVISRVVGVSKPLLVGMSALVGVDTYLSDEQKPQPVEIDRSHVGLRDRIQRPGSLDPRLEGGG